MPSFNLNREKYKGTKFVKLDGLHRDGKLVPFSYKFNIYLKDGKEHITVIPQGTDPQIREHILDLFRINPQEEFTYADLGEKMNYGEDVIRQNVQWWVDKGKIVEIRKAFNEPKRFKLAGDKHE